jgi:hypothetical protein
MNALVAPDGCEKREKEIDRDRGMERERKRGRERERKMERKRERERPEIANAGDGNKVALNGDDYSSI